MIERLKHGNFSSYTRKFFAVLPWGICAFLTLIVVLNFRNSLSLQKLDKPELEAFIGAELPESATEIRTAYLSALDAFVLVRFQLPSHCDCIDPFLAEMGLEDELQENYMPGSMAEDRINWWDVDQAVVYSGAEFTIRLSETKIYQILLDKSDQTTWIVYLIVSTM